MIVSVIRWLNGRRRAGEGGRGGPREAEGGRWGPKEAKGSRGEAAREREREAMNGREMGKGYLAGKCLTK